ncbi:MAG: acyltransferase [Clostridia bacterium]|nr:acyltransferase [Clostridia bacterium]
MKTESLRITPNAPRGRNGLIDLYRFILAINVLKSHSLFIYRGPYMGPGRVSVEFFFVLSGFLFATYLEKHRDDELKSGLFRMLWDKLRPLMIPTVIALVCNSVNSILEGGFNPFGYLWYVKSMIIALVFYYMLRLWVRRDNIFLLITAAICLTATALKFFTICYPQGEIRAFSELSLGILLAYVPSLKLKKNWPVIPPLALVAASCLTIVFFGLGDVEYAGVKWVEMMLDLLLYPALVYLSFQLDVRSRWMSYLGAISFGLYAFQCPADLIRTLGVSDVNILFAIILALTLIEDSTKRIIKARKNKINLEA